MKFYIKKVVEAKTAIQALRKEKSGVITDVWRDETAKDDLVSAFGFQVQNDKHSLPEDNKRKR